MRSTKKLDKHLEKVFENLISLIKKRRAASNNLSWCFRDEIRFMPDYLTLGRFGRNSFEKSVSFILSTFFPSLWLRTIWKKIYIAMLREIDQKYLAQIFCEYSDDFKKLPERNYFLIKLRSIMKKANSAIRFATFTELFLFLSVVLRVFLKYLGRDHDAYKDIKNEQNEIGLSLYKELRQEILARKNSFDLACYLCLRANWIDCSINDVDGFLKGFLEEINNIIDHGEDLKYQLDHNFFFQTERFKAMLNSPKKTILYELDNAGEVIFDFLLIEILLNMGHNLIITAKKEPILNDVTFNELKELVSSSNFPHFSTFLQNNQLQLIHSNSGMTGKNLFSVSRDYKKAYKQADIIVLKGQGNFQTMPIGKRIRKRFIPFQYRKKLVFMMGVKSELILACLKKIVTHPFKVSKDMFFLYCFDPQDSLTHP